MARRYRKKFRRMRVKFARRYRRLSSRIARKFRRVRRGRRIRRYHASRGGIRI